MQPGKRSDRAVASVYELARTLSVPRPWDLAKFVDQLSMAVGKPIRLTPMTGLSVSGFACGLVVERDRDIVIAYAATSSTYHTDHIVLHEIGHLLLNHAGHAATDATRVTIESLFPELDPDSVLRVLERTDYDDDTENQAELFASLIMAESHRKSTSSILRRAILGD